MPNRIIREGILTSDRVEQLDAPAEVFYRRLMSKVDDHGLYDARPSILRTSLYPLRVDKVKEADIAKWLAACQKAGLVACYQNEGRALLQMLHTRWQTRSDPKYPLPSDANSSQVISAANSCAQTQTNEHLVGVVVEGVVANVVGDVGATGLFADFWRAYPKKVGKPEALRAFAKLEPEQTLLDEMLRALAWQRESDGWRKDGGQYIPNPATWLNQARWTDEPVRVAPYETPKAKAARLEAEKWAPRNQKEFIDAPIRRLD